MDARGSKKSAIDPAAIVILDVFEKKTQTTPQRIIEICRRRLKQYEASFL
jgi:phage-related protein